jgi:hypothetical protein
MSGWPNNSSILLSNPRCVEKLGKTDDFLSVDDLRGEAGAAPRNTAGEVPLEVCLLRYSDIFGDDDSAFGLEITSKYSQGAKLWFEHT